MEVVYAMVSYPRTDVSANRSTSWRWHSYLLGVPGAWRCWTVLQSVVVTLSQGPGDYTGASSITEQGDIKTVSDLTTPISHILLSPTSITE